MAQVIIFIIIAYFIKKGMTQSDGKWYNLRKGLSGMSDLGKIISVIAVIVFIIALLNNPVIFALVLVAIIAFVIWLVQKIKADQRSEKYGWNTEEYQKKYSECLEKFKNAYKEARASQEDYKNMNETQRRAQILKNEKMAMERAKEEAEAYMRSKYGDPKENAARARREKKNARSASADGQNSGSGAGTFSGNTSGKKPESLKSKILPKAGGKRSKIIQNFSEKYDLYLTDEQIKRISDASYMSVAWKKEVEAMAGKYDAVFEWMTGDTAYLRAYLRAFTVQDVTSDFRQQMQIVMDSFEEVFEYSDTYKALSIDQRIEKINAKFMTNFDEITYMIAYRYLESLGLHHELDKTQLNRADGSFDDLVQKYENMSEVQVDAELNANKTAE